MNRHRWINSALCVLGLGLIIATIAAAEHAREGELLRLELAGPLPLPLPIPVASGDEGAAAAAAAAADPWTLVNSCALTSDLLCSADDVVFARASAATCDHADGTRTSVATGVACHDATWGLRVERTSRTNTIVYSDAISGGSWTPGGGGGVAAPTVTGDQATGRDGQLLCDKIDLPSVQNASEYSIVYQGFTATAAAWSGTMDIKGVSGSGTVYLRMGATVTYPTAVCAYTAGAWSRCEVENSTLTAATHYLVIGVDLQAGTSQSAQGAQSIYACAAQAELGAWSSSYIVTEASTVARAAETATLATTGWNPASVRITETVRWIVDPDAASGTHFLWQTSGAAYLGIFQGTPNLEVAWSDGVGSSAATAVVAWNADTSYNMDEQYADDAITIFRDGITVLTDTSTINWPSSFTSPANLPPAGDWSDHWIRAFNVYEPTP